MGNPQAEWFIAKSIPIKIHSAFVMEVTLIREPGITVVSNAYGRLIATSNLSGEIEFTLTTTLRGRHCFYPHSTENKTDAQRGQVTWPSSPRSAEAELRMKLQTVDGRHLGSS